MATADNTYVREGGLQSQPVKSTLTQDQRQRRWGFIFLSPWIIGFLSFTFLPMLASLIFTFLNFELDRPDDVTFAGLKNYERLLRDPNVRTSLWVTAKYMAVALPLSVIIPLSLATLLNAKNLWGKRLLRTLFYMPYIVPLVSVIYIFSGYLNGR